MNRLLFGFLLFPFLLFSQNETKIDSLNQLIQEEKSDSLKSSLLIKKALLYQKSSKIDSALNTINNAIKVSDRSTVNYTKVRGYIVLGNIYLNQYKYDLAFKNYAIADSICNFSRDLKESSIHAQALNFLGYAVRLTHDYDKSAEFYLKSKNIYTKLNDQKGVHEVNIGLAQSFIPKGEYNKALSFLNDAVKYNKDNNTGNPYSYAVICRGYLLVKMKRFEDAEKDYLTYYNLANESNNVTKKLRSLSYLGYLYFEKGDLSKAEKYYKQGVEMAKKEENLFMVEETQRGLINVLKKSNNLEALSRVYEEYLETKEKQDSVSKSSEIYELETKYQATQKEQEIALLNAENKLSEQRRKNEKYVYLGLLFIALLLATFIFYAYKNKLKTSRKLKELNALKSKFFANISHEFRTPLTLIKSPVQFLRNSQDKEVQNQLNVIDRNADKMLELVDQLLELSKIEANQLKILLKKGNVPSFLFLLLEAFVLRAQNEKKDFIVDVEATDKLHVFDKDILTKIIYNLLSNAFKYSDDDASITFSSKIFNEKLYITVSNKNYQFNTNEILKIFNRFYQGDSKHTGFGIGLSLTKELVDLYEGTIKVSKEGERVVFDVEIPLTHHLKNAVLINDNEIIEDNNVEIYNDEHSTLLIVDDHKDVLNVLKNIFKSSFIIYEANDGAAAFKIAEKEIPDIIISDVIMPIEDGFTLASKVKNNKLTSHIPVILLTAKSSDEAHLKALQNHSDSFLTKPFNHEILKAKVVQIIDERKKLQERYSKELILKPIDVVVNTVEEKFLDKIEKIITSNLTSPDFNAQEFALQMNVSRMQLHRKLKSLFGVSTSEFIRNERLKLAAKLLKNPKLSVADVAYSSGFNEVTYFSKCFKGHFGVSPSIFQKNK